MQMAGSSTHEVEALDENWLLNTAPEDLKQYFVERHGITPITLLQDHWYALVKTERWMCVMIPLRWIDDRGQPAMNPRASVPRCAFLRGRADLFYTRPNQFTMNPLRAAHLRANELVLRYRSPADAPLDVRPQVDRTLADIERSILGGKKSGGDGDIHNANLSGAAEQVR